MFTVANSTEYNYGLCHDGSGSLTYRRQPYQDGASQFDDSTEVVFLTGLLLASGTLKQSQQNGPLAARLQVSYPMAATLRAVTGFLSNTSTRSPHQETPSTYSELETGLHRSWRLRIAIAAVSGYYSNK